MLSFAGVLACATSSALSSELKGSSEGYHCRRTVTCSDSTDAIEKASVRRSV